MFDVNDMTVTRFVEDEDIGCTVDVYEGEYKGIKIVLKAESEMPGADYDEADYWEITYYKDGEEVGGGMYEKWYSERFNAGALERMITEDIQEILAEIEAKRVADELAKALAEADEKV